MRVKEAENDKKWAGGTGLHEITLGLLLPSPRGQEPGPCPQGVGGIVKSPGSPEFAQADSSRGAGVILGVWRHPGGVTSHR